MRSGDVYWVNLEPSMGDEIRKKRPVVVVNPGHRKHLRLAIVVPVTSWRPEWEDHPFFVSLDPSSENGLDKRSVVDCFQIRAVSHERFMARVGSVFDNELDKMKKAMALILDIDPEHCQ